MTATDTNIVWSMDFSPFQEIFRTWMKNGDLAGLVQQLLTLSGDDPNSTVTRDELKLVKQFVKLAMKIKIAEAMRGGTTYTYDGNGNIISADNISYEYDSQNRMTGALVNYPAHRGGFKIQPKTPSPPLAYPAKGGEGIEGRGKNILSPPPHPPPSRGRDLF